MLDKDIVERKWRKGFPDLDGDYYCRVDEFDKQPTLIRIESRTSSSSAALYEFGCSDDLRREYEAETDYEYLGPITPELLRALADEAERLRGGFKDVSGLANVKNEFWESAEKELDEIRACDKCDLCEDHHE